MTDYCLDALYFVTKPTAEQIAAAAWTATADTGLSGGARVEAMLAAITKHFDDIQADIIAACHQKVSVTEEKP